MHLCTWTGPVVYSGEHCQECGIPVVFFTRSYWLTDDDLWREVTGADSGVLCPPCFTTAAHAKGIGLHWEAVRGG